MSLGQTSLVKIFIVIALVSSVACGELRELTRLADDTSNDFTILSSTSVEVRSALAIRNAPTSPVVPAYRVGVTLNRPFSDPPRPISVFRSSRDVLALHSILR